MSSPVPPAIEMPQLISMLLPTRGRPKECSRLLDSIEQTATDHKLISVRCLVDSDDQESISHLSRIRDSKRFNIEVFVSGPTLTQGERYNLLHKNLRPTAGIVMPMADDVIFATSGWDKLIRDTMNSYPDRIVMCFPDDETVGLNQATYTVVSADWINLIGQFASGLFPYWYEDVWMDEVASLIDRKVRLPFKIEAPEGKGKTQGMRNLKFWERFFWNTSVQRYAEALTLIRYIYRDNPTRLKEEAENVLLRVQSLRSHYRKRGDAEFLNEELSYTGVVPGSVPPERYLKCEFRAVQWLVNELRKEGPHGDQNRIAELLLNLMSAYPETTEAVRGI